MITKKAIFKWWEERGRIIDGKQEAIDFKARRDLASFEELINGRGREAGACYSQERGKNGKGLIYTLIAKRWRYPLKVYFLGGEAIRISGF